MFAAGLSYIHLCPTAIDSLSRNKTCPGRRVGHSDMDGFRIVLQRPVFCVGLGKARMFEQCAFFFLCLSTICHVVPASMRFLLDWSPRWGRFGISQKRKSPTGRNIPCPFGKFIMDDGHGLNILRLFCGASFLRTPIRRTLQPLSSWIMHANNKTSRFLAMLFAEFRPCPVYTPHHEKVNARLSIKLKRCTRDYRFSRCAVVLLLYFL